MIDDLYFDAFPEIESQRLIFRKFALEDSEEIYAIRSNDAVMKYMDADFHNNIQDAKTFIENGMETYRKKEGLFWVIMDKKTQAFVGDFSFWRIDRKNVRAEIGYTMKPRFWGQGYMTETLTTLIDFGFTKLGIHSFVANINPENNNSRKLLLKIGFQKEGYFRENYCYHGTFLDSETYGLLISDFRQKSHQVFL